MCIGNRLGMPEDCDAMDKLDPKALELLAAYRSSLDPPADAQARVWDGVGETIEHESRARRRLQQVGWVVALAAVCAGLWVFRSHLIVDTASSNERAHQAVYARQGPKSRAHLAVPTPSKQHAPVVESTAVETPQPAAEPELAKRPEVEQPQKQVRKPRAKVQPQGAGSIAEELQLVQRAEQKLHKQQYRAALGLLERHQRQFGERGQLQPEATASRVTALCSLGRRAQGKKLQQSFLTRWPTSPLRARVLAACEDPSE